MIFENSITTASLGELFHCEIADIYDACYSFVILFPCVIDRCIKKISSLAVSIINNEKIERMIYAFVVHRNRINNVWFAVPTFKLRNLSCDNCREARPIIAKPVAIVVYELVYIEILKQISRLFGNVGPSADKSIDINKQFLDGIGFAEPVYNPLASLR